MAFALRSHSVRGVGHSRSTAYAALSKTALALMVAALFALAPAGAAAAAPGRLAYVTFANNNTLAWVGGPNGQNPTQLAQADEPTVSPNGQFVALVSSTNIQAVLVYSVNGTLVARYSGAEGPLTFSSNSRYLAMQRGGLQVADLSSGAVRQLARGQFRGASFAPTGSRLVYGLSKSEALNSPVNLFTINANGTSRKQLTTNGRSANPVWGSKGIAFDQITYRGTQSAPSAQLYVMSGGRTRQITNLKIPSLLTGLVPMYIASDGVHMVAAYSGQDTDQAWTVNLSTKKLVRLTASKQYVSPYGISRNGKRALVALGGFEGPPTGSVATIPFSGGKATILVKHAGIPSWNQ